MDSDLERDWHEHWRLDTSIHHLNHGSFGACPGVVLDYQRAMQDRLEASPVPFMTRELRPLYDESRSRLAELIGAETAGLVAVPNATAGVNTVLRSLQLDHGSEILISNHGYNACSNVARFLAEHQPGTKVLEVSIPFPVENEDEVFEAVIDSVNDQTRFVLLDHVTSPTGMILPIERIVAELNRRGIESMIDGAHAPGMLPLDLTSLNATYYTGNCHKWLCSPKSVGFLYVAERARERVAPLVISHGWNVERFESCRLHDLFDWPGTFDPSVWLSVAASIDFLESLLPGGLVELQRRNHRLVVAARQLLCEQLGVAPPCPDEMLGSLATLPLPTAAQGVVELDATVPTPCDPLIGRLLKEFRIDVPVFTWNQRRLFRVSAQAYNRLEQYRMLGDALLELVGTGS